MKVSRTAEKTKVHFWIGLLIVVFYLLVEGFSFLSLSLVERATGLSYTHALRVSLTPEQRESLRQFVTGQSKYFISSPTLGWTIQPGGAVGLYRANSQGLRADRDYALKTPPGKVRMAAFGDSFIHGDEVRIGETWESALERLDGRLEVLNFGVNGYGPDQAFLRYKEQGVVFQPQVVLIGLLSENIRRTVSVFRPFYYQDTRFPLTKPRFFIEGDRLVLMENPYQEKDLARLGTYDYHYRIRSDPGPLDFLPTVRLLKMIQYAYRSRFGPSHILRWDGTYDPHSEAFRITLKILEAFRKEALENVSFPLIILFPERQDLIKFRTRGIRRYGPLIETLRGHPSPLGNAIVARFLFNYLRENHLI